MINYTSPKSTKLHYYKYRERVWKKPTLYQSGFINRYTPSCWTSSTLDGGAGNQPYNFYNGTYQWHSANWQDQSFYWYNPNPLRIREISFKMYRGGGGYFYGSNDGNNWTQLYEWGLGSSEWSGTANLEFKNNNNYYKYYWLRATWSGYNGRGYNYTVFAELYVNAMEQYIEEVTENDAYDYTELHHCQHITKNQAIITNNIRTEFLPDFVNNHGGTIYNSFVLSASHEANPAFWARRVDTQTSEKCWWTNHGVTSATNPCWWQFKSEFPVCASQVSIQNEVSTPANFKHGYVQASNDGVNWVTLREITGINETAASMTWGLEITPRHYYTYYRLYFDESFGPGGISIQNIQFNLIQKLDTSYITYNMKRVNTRPSEPELEPEPQPI